MASGLQLCVDLPLDGLAVGLGVDVRLFKKIKVYISRVQICIQLATLVGAAAHAGNGVKNNSVSGLHSAQQFVQFCTALIFSAGINFADNMGIRVRGQYVAHLPLNILSWGRNPAIAVGLHRGLTSDVRFIYY